MNGRALCHCEPPKKGAWQSTWLNRGIVLGLLSRLPRRLGLLAMTGSRRVIVFVGTVVLICILTCTSSVLASANLQLKLVSLNNGRASSKFIATVPFELQVILSGEIGDPKIVLPVQSGITQQVGGVIRSTSNINGQVTHSQIHRYRLQIDQVGKYIIGPVELWEKGKLVQAASLPCEIVVAAESAGDSVPAQALLRLSSATVYRGERFTAQISLELDEAHRVLNQVIWPNYLSQKFKILEVRGPEVKQHDARQVYTWEVDLCAIQVGQLVLPAVQLHFEQGGRDLRSSFFGSQERTILTNAADLVVESLPVAAEGLVVGELKELTAELDQVQLPQNQAATWRFELTGQVDWEQFKFELQNVPSGLKIYLGKVEQSPERRVWEYVIQGLQVGQFELPVQVLKFFNPRAKQIVELQTKPVKLEILPAIATQTKSTISASKPTRSTWSKELIAVIIGLSWLILGTICRGLRRLNLSKKEALLDQEQAIDFNLNNQLFALSRLQEAGQADQLHKFFVHFFVQYAKLPKSFGDPSQLSADEQKDLSNFMGQLEEIAFGHNWQLVNPELWQIAQSWVIRFLKN